MAGYERWAPFYDAMRGDQAAPAAYVRALIEKHHPAAETLLELGCGTGAILEHLDGRYTVTGVDLSQPMLRIARTKLPHARLLRRDITTVELGETFDAVVCVADVVNHLRPFRAWEATFARAHEHLADGGIFVFDMNTQLHLSELAAGPPATTWSPQGDFTMLDVAEAAGAGVEVEITVFEHERRDLYRLHTATVPEISFPVERVTTSLRRRFRRVRVYDETRSRPSPLSERLHIVCTR
ncbi:MAG TPA: class I SAM-dependent methyltransferase [Gaiellaceae bacterium]